MSKLTIMVNGRRHTVAATPDTPLLYVLRNELRLHGPRFGCGLAQCGACTVHLGDKAIYAHMLISTIQVCLVGYFWMHLQKSDALTWLE